MNKLLACLLVWILVGCAGTVNKDQVLSFDSNTNPVKVNVNGLSCDTPCQLIVPSGRKGAYIAGEKEGYKRVTKPLDRKLSGSALLFDVLVGIWIWPAGLTTTAADAASGELFEYEPNGYYFDMVKKEEERISFKESKPDVFYMQNIQILRNEATVGGGEHLETLAAMLKIDTAALKHAIEQKSDKEMLEYMNRIQDEAL